ncbi:MAG: ribbon-helix-helix protein, CopG family [Victivallales bacterium]|jgi:CopG family transcriptional regulator / antitoxin EndoAI|nr:ribbon-helix-helix protein, CopG family [Victivallales bacterium]
MAAVTVNISFQPDLLASIDAEAAKEARNRSELLREAARLYIERQRRWDHVFSLGDEATRAHGLSEADVAEQIAASRGERRGPE